MARLPIPGGDSGDWGTILNDYLTQVHNTDGSLKDNVVTGAALAPNAVDATVIADGSITNVLIADGTIQETKLATAVQTKLNAVAGTPDWNTLTNKPAVIAAGADQATARSAIGAGTSNLALGGTGSALTAAKSDHTQTASTISDSTTIGRTILTAVDAAAVKTALSLTKTDVGLGNVDNTSDAIKNAATATLTNKTISGASNTLSNIPESAVTNLTTDLAAKVDRSVIPIQFGAAVAMTGVTPTDRAYVARTLTGARMRVASAPSGSALTAQVQHYNGSAWSTIGTLTISDGSVVEATASFTQAQNIGDLLRLNVTSVGSTSAATGVMVDVLWS